MGASKTTPCARQLILDCPCAAQVQLMLGLQQDEAEKIESEVINATMGFSI